MVLTFDGEAVLTRLRGDGRNLTWFCAQIGVSRHTFYRWLWGKRVPSEAHARRMAAILDCPVGDLFLPAVLPQGSESLPQVNPLEAVTA